MADIGEAAVGSVPIGAGRGGRYWGRFYSLISVAAIVATIGLNANSGAVVIAAMLLAPLMEPILGIASNLVQGHLGRIVRLLANTILAAFVAVGLGYLILLAFRIPPDIEIPGQVLARTNPSLADLVVAIVAGIAGSYVQMRKEDAGLLPGVAIGVSLVPPLSACGMLLYFAQPRLAGEAALLFVTNLAASVLTAAAVFFVLGMRPSRRLSGSGFRVILGVVLTITAVVVIATHLTERTLQYLQQARDERTVVRVIKDWAGPHSVEVHSIEVEGDRVSVRLLYGVPLERAREIAAPRDLISEELHGDRIAFEIARALGRDIELEFTGMLKFEASGHVPYLPQDGASTEED